MFPSRPSGEDTRSGDLQLGEFRDREPIWFSITLVAAIVVVLPVWLELPSLSAAGLVILAILGARLRMGGSVRFLRATTHLVYLLALGAIAHAIFWLDLPSVISVYFSAIVLLHAAHLLGARAVSFWAVPFMGLVVISSIAAPEAERSVSVATVLTVRAATLVTITGFAVAFRRAHDRQADELKRLATTDSLTGLANRHELERALGDALVRAQRHERQGCVIFLDLDGLKGVNDGLGHSAGDGLIRTVATRIARHTRRTDTAARMGGDEFVVLLAEISDAKAAATVARKMLEAVSAPCTIEDHALEPKASVGVALFPDSAVEPDQLLSLADAAMYQAKRDGGGRIMLNEGGGLREIH